MLPAGGTPAPQWPEDVRHFYSVLGGMPDAVCDRHLFRFWRKSELVAVSVIFPAQPWVGTCFCDWSVSALTYAFGPTGDPRVAIVDDQEPRFVALSFAEFLQRYADDDRRLYG